MAGMGGLISKVLKSTVHRISWLPKVLTLSRLKANSRPWLDVGALARIKTAKAQATRRLLPAPPPRAKLLE